MFVERKTRVKCISHTFQIIGDLDWHINEDNLSTLIYIKFWLNPLPTNIFVFNFPVIFNINHVTFVHVIEWTIANLCNRPTVLAIF